MNKYDLAIGTIVTLLIIDALFIGYCLGLLDFFKVGIQSKNIPAVAMGTVNTTTGTSAQQPPPTQPESQQEQQTEQPTREDNQQEEQSGENDGTISEVEAINLVEQIYQNDGHVVVIGQDSDSFNIGCFMETIFKCIQ